ncbi:PrgI family protein [Gemelliphila palaticanis]|uniref:PrgI family protein n=1 Tax=Gemelliphila palaticanis TaxID=81950 RepID=A0ABX2T3R8_9BACL|nr:PrgI family protein [Gemella palaticanis]MBF0715721.1 PrgI family protein [Gemella palaticanis]NYS47651.1 PrgI family protein [Gemella palaticanis]
MAKVDIPVDLSKIKPTAMLGLTARQLYFVIPSLVISAIIAYVLRSDVGDFLAFIIFCILFILMALPGFFDKEKGGFGNEIKKIIKQKYYYKQIRYTRKEDHIEKENQKKV